MKPESALQTITSKMMFCPDIFSLSLSMCNICSSKVKMRKNKEITFALLGRATAGFDELYLFSVLSFFRLPAQLPALGLRKIGKERKRESQRERERESQRERERERVKMKP